jgi:hypothetical protein
MYVRRARRTTQMRQARSDQPVRPNTPPTSTLRVGATHAAQTARSLKYSPPGPIRLPSSLPAFGSALRNSAALGKEVVPGHAGSTRPKRFTSIQNPKSKIENG